MILVALAGVAIFLTVEGMPRLQRRLRTTCSGASNFVAYVWPLLFGTLLAATLALLIATPLALGVALVISHYAPAPAGHARSATSIDLLAAVPSVVYGLWGSRFLGPHLTPALRLARRRTSASCRSSPARRRPPAGPSSPPASCWRS